MVLALGAYVAWFNWSGSGNRVVDAVPAVPPRLEQAAQEGQRLREGAAPAAPTQAAAAANPALQAPAAPPPPPATPAVAPPAPVGDGPRVVLRARGESWVQIRDSRANTLVTDRVLRANETLPVPNRDGLVLTTGKAESLDILLDGQVTAVLAGATGVRRGIALDVERLRATDAAARPAAPTPAAPAAAPAAPRPATAPAAGQPAAPAGPAAPRPAPAPSPTNTPARP